MAAEGTAVETDDLMVTTGGQQVIDLVCRAFLDPGDVVVAEAPTYPGAVPCFTLLPGRRRAGRDGRRRHADRRAGGDARPAARARAARPKFIYTIPNFQNPGGVTMSLERRHALVRIAAEQELVILEDNPYGLLRYEGEPLPTLYSLDGGRYVIYAGHLLEDPLRRPADRLGGRPAADPRAPEPGQAGRRPVLLAAEPVLRGRLLRPPRLADLPGQAARDLPPPARRDAGRAGGVPAPGGDWTRPQGGLFIWARLPDYIDTTDLLARALRENVAFVPGRAAYLDGRGGSEMRLNFSGVGEDDIREGIRRIGEVVSEQVALYGTLTGAKPAPRGAGRGARRGAAGACYRYDGGGRGRS